MNMYRTLWLVVLSLLTLGVVLLAPAHAQGPADLSAADPTAAADAAPAADPAPAASPAPAAPLPDTPSTSKAAADDSWRVRMSIYGWFAGVHGTVGVAGHNAGVHVPFSDLFHYLKGIIPIAVEADKGRFIMPIDYIWAMTRPSPSTISVRLLSMRTLPSRSLRRSSAIEYWTASISRSMPWPASATGMSARTLPWFLPGSVFRVPPAGSMGWVV